MTEPANPVHDQQRAANREAMELYTKFVDAHQEKFGPAVDITTADTEAPSRKIIDKWMAQAKLTGGACVHVSDSPEVVFAAGCLPGIAFCAECIKPHMIDKQRRMHDTYGGRECDACEAVTTHGREGVLKIYSIVMFVSMCVQCGEKAMNE